MTNPVPGKSQGTPYGQRGSYWSCNRDSAGNGIHTGCDYPAPTGTQVVAARGGTVVWCNHGSAFGSHQIEVTPGDGTRDFYAHLSSRVANGTKVKTGDPVGKVGAEGNVTGPHLHFERHTVASGPWSCGVVTNPKPSIDAAAPAPTPTPPPKDLDMPTAYVSARLAAPKALAADTWYTIQWDRDDGPFTKGGPGVHIAGRIYSAVLTFRVGKRGGANVRTQFFEWADGDPYAESNPVVGHDQDYSQDARTGKVGKGRQLRVQIKCDGPGATLSDAELTLVYW